jgi:hypothetical protein
MDDFYGDPMILNLPDFGEPDMDARAPIVQPQSNLDKVTGVQRVRGSDPRAGFVELEHAAIGFQLSMYTGQHAIDRQIWNGPTGLLISYSHDVKTG